MKRIQIKRNMLFTTLISLLFLASCTVYRYSEPALAVTDIVQMSKDGVPAENIIKDIKKSHSVYDLKANELAELSREGVSDQVLNYMDRTRINSIRQEERMNSYNYWSPYDYWYGPGFGWPYYGYGYIGPTVIIHGHNGGGHYHGGGGHYRH